MLVYLCDSCHAPIGPDEVDASRSPSGALLCARCRPKPTAPTPGPRPDCGDCQVAQQLTGVPGGSHGSNENVFCSTCEKIAGTPGKKFRCHVCRTIVTLDDLRRGRAVTQGEKAFCSTCRRRMADPETVRPRPAAPPAPVPRKTAAAAPAPRPETPDPPAASGAPLECDLCHKVFTLEDLRTGKAEIREGRVLCPRCIARIDRKKRRFDLRFAAALVFILVVFPVVGGLLVFEALSNRGAPTRGTPPDPAPPAPRDPGAPPPLPAASQTPPAGEETPAPAAAAPTIPQADLAQIVKNLRESMNPAAPAPAGPPAASDVSPKGPRPAADLDEVRTLLASPDPEVRLEGILRLASTPDGGPGLRAALRDPDPYVRSAAASILGRRKDPEALGPLLALIYDPEFMVRKAATVALVDVANLKFRNAEDLSTEELENIKRFIEDRLRRKSDEGSRGE